MQDRELYRRILGIESPWFVERVDLKLKRGSERREAESVSKLGVDEKAFRDDENRRCRLGELLFLFRHRGYRDVHQFFEALITQVLRCPLRPDRNSHENRSRQT